MKLSRIVTILLLCPATLALAQDALPTPANQPLPDLQTATDNASYGIGVNIGRSLREDGLELNLRMFAQGLKDAYEGAELKLTDAQLNAAFQVFNQEMQKKRQAEAAAVGEKNKRDGAAFLAANKNKPGVRTLPSGLQYQILKQGNGASPKATDIVETHYHGTLLDGTVFDSSVQRGEPATFPVNRVIAGWTEALQLMHVGDKWRLFVPSELAYGQRGAGGAIGPNATLIFEVELLGIQ